MSYKYSFIGVGNIANAIIAAMSSLKGNINIASSDIYLYDKSTSQMDKFNGKYNILSSIAECILQTDFIFLCVKPQNYREVLEHIRDMKTDLTKKTFVSVAAGISTAQICECLGFQASVIRTMPNTPMTIGLGVCAICHNEKVDAKKFQNICRILSARSELLVLDESKMNKIIGITSSSPAYVYKFIDALYDAAIKEGLDDPKILDCICKVFIGSAQMVLNSNVSTKDLIRAVKSPNGTTERALCVFDKNDFDNIITEAVVECNKRADTLGEEM